MFEFDRGECTSAVAKRSEEMTRVTVGNHSVHTGTHYLLPDYRCSEPATCRAPLSWWLAEMNTGIFGIRSAHELDCSSALRE